jgi:hypothetical protein
MSSTKKSESLTPIWDELAARYAEIQAMPEGGAR